VIVPIRARSRVSSNVEPAPDYFGGMRLVKTATPARLCAARITGKWLCISRPCTRPLGFRQAARQRRTVRRNGPAFRGHPDREIRDAGLSDERPGAGLPRGERPVREQRAGRSRIADAAFYGPYAAPRPLGIPRTTPGGRHLRPGPPAATSWWVCAMTGRLRRRAHKHTRAARQYRGAHWAESYR